MGERVNPYIREVEREILKFSPTEEIARLTDVQKVNQRVNLSFFGRKIEMPFKLLSSITSIEIIKDVAHIPKEKFAVLDAYKLEIIHPLGKMYCRFDVPREMTTSTINSDAIAVTEMNMKAKRDFEDYLMERKQYDLEFETMDLSHRQARLGRKYEWVNQGIGFAMDLATTGVVGWRLGKISSRMGDIIEQRYNQRKKKYDALIKKKPALEKRLKRPERESLIDLPYRFQNMQLAAGYGAYKGISGTASGIAGLINISERASLQEEGFALQIREKALRSYEIDLGFERDKDEQLFTMRRIFANQTYNQVTDRQRQKILDELETPSITDEIYLEVWTTSGEQEDYVNKYHEKFGVDCRVAKKEIPIRDDMRLGIYCIEDVEIFNLTDRVDFEYLKARLTGGIRFIQWEEFKGEKEYHPLDETVKALKQEIVLLKKQHQEEKVLIDENIKQLTSSNEQLHNQVSVDTERYHELTENYKKKEAELQTQTNLAVLYKNEADHFKADLLKSDQEHAQEKEGHSDTKKQLEQEKEEHSSTKKSLEDKTRETQDLTRQVDQQIIQIGQKDKKIKELEEQLADAQMKTLQTENKNKKLIADNAQLIEKNQACEENTKGDKQKIEQQEKNWTQLQKEFQTLQAEKNKIQDTLTETQETLEAVREIEKGLRQSLGSEIASKAISHILWTFFTGWCKKTYVWFLGDGSESRINLYQWDHDYCVFYLALAQKTFKVWKWWGKGSSYLGSGYDMQFFYKFDDDEYASTQLRDYHRAGYQTDTQTNWPNKDDWRRTPFKKAVYVGEWGIVRCELPSGADFPRIKNKIGVSGATIDNLELEEPIYFMATEVNRGGFVWKKGEPKLGQKKLTLYKEYLDFIGLKWDERQKKAIPKSW